MALVVDLATNTISNSATYAGRLKYNLDNRQLSLEHSPVRIDKLLVSYYLDKTWTRQEGKRLGLHICYHASNNKERREHVVQFSSLLSCLMLEHFGEQNSIMSSEFKCALYEICQAVLDHIKTSAQFHTS